MAKKTRKPKPVNFICKLCGIQAAQAILCTREGCPSELTAFMAASPKKQ